jgi:hypothetical protein
MTLEEKPTFIKRKEVIEWFGNSNEYINIHQEQLNNKRLMGDF